MAFLSPSAAARDDDYSRLLASPAQFLPSPLAQGLFASPAAMGSKGSFAVQSGRLSFDVLLHDHDSQESTQGPCALEAFREEEAAKHESHLKGQLLTAAALQLAVAFAPVFGPPLRPARQTLRLVPRIELGAGRTASLTPTDTGKLAACNGWPCAQLTIPPALDHCCSNPLAA